MSVAADVPGPACVDDVRIPSVVGNQLGLAMVKNTIDLVGDKLLVVAKFGYNNVLRVYLQWFTMCVYPIFVPPFTRS